jgi:hypothetical protein
MNRLVSPELRARAGAREHCEEWPLVSFGRGRGARVHYRDPTRPEATLCGVVWIDRGPLRVVYASKERGGAACTCKVCFRRGKNLCL